MYLQCIIYVFIMHHICIYNASDNAFTVNQILCPQCIRCVNNASNNVFTMHQIICLQFGSDVSTMHQIVFTLHQMCLRCIRWVYNASDNVYNASDNVSTMHQIYNEPTMHPIMYLQCTRKCIYNASDNVSTMHHLMSLQCTR